ncbi:bud emergence protein 1 [Tilletia horrida]|uniref:Bud emergence protein 1 n=1 Tax=Tilletia horrida TaxID=155126 RepID=A0AAN6G6D7_9BASI|nr:bud emergence protein 1 [Tilletia horrida]KAK0520854.1 bud emergence protein 1 [Tilletia horrida]KAK0540573.1 bud emergence protein 1 [Tilletia horrida]KAK0550602.1 bud emergence protein 1 [Tilletia horrida]
MKGLKDFRRSLNKDRTSRGAAPTTYTGVRSATAATKQPPSKVIRATRDYRARQPNELSFSKGDFFHVLNDSTHPEWFEAVNPISNARGHVPAAYFDVLTKTARPGLTALPVPQSPTIGGPPPSIGGAGVPADAVPGPGGAAAGGPPGSTVKGGGLYAVVKYDFEAERPDELDSKAGDSIIVIAQSNFEWFVARPIGKLGGPGLIPVAFVEIRDMVTGRAVENVQELIQNGFIPKVEEWKKMKADYTKNTIPLGRFDDFNGAAQPGMAASPYGMPGEGGPSPNGMGPGGMGGMGMGGASPSGPFMPGQPGVDGMLPPDAQAGGMDMYNSMRHDHALPDPPSEELELPAGMAPGEPLPCGIIDSARVDSFHYEQGDYWFRIQATHIAGPSPAPPEVLRAPTGEVRELILYRLYEDFYEFQLALLEHFPAEAGRETGPNGQSNERILPLMPGPIDEVDDVITSQRRADLDTYIQELCALPEHIRKSELLRVFFEPRPGDHCTRLPLQAGGGAGPGAGTADGSGPRLPGAGEDAGGATVPEGGSTDPVTSNGTRKYAEDQPVNPAARPDPLAESVASLSLGSGKGEGDSSVSGPGSDARSSAGTGGTSFGHLQPMTMLTKTDTQGSSGSGGGRSGVSPSAGSAAAGASGGFIKIKIFNRASDDLVAIRVPPDVSFSGLMGKVRERLGNEIAVMRYRDESGMMRLSDDDDLSEWIASGQKLTLWADVR